MEARHHEASLPLSVHLRQSLSVEPMPTLTMSERTPFARLRQSLEVEPPPTLRLRGALEDFIMPLSRGFYIFVPFSAPLY